jgi:drug/metabolite transporter (DMT)-like permease
MAISYITPLLNMVAALLILKEKAKSHHLLAVLVGFAGAMLIIHPIFQGEREGYVLALFTVIIWVVGDVLMKIQSRSARVITQCFYTNLFALLFMLPFAYYYWQTPTTIEIAWVIVIGLIQALNLVAIFKAYSLADMVVIVPLDFTRLLFTMILAYLIYAETINRTSMLGALIILFSTYYLAARERYKVSTV